MEVYVLDDDYRETAVIDAYQSLLWTERFSSLGDFELKTEYNHGIDGLLRRGTLISIKESRRVGVVESISEGRDEDGVSVMTYSGRLFESIFEDRVAYSLSVSSHKARTNELVQRSILEGFHNPDDAIFRIRRGTGVVYPPSTIPPSMMRTTSEIAGWGEVLEAHEDANSQAPLGFRIVREKDEEGVPYLYYDNYTGIDRSVPSDYELPDETWGFHNPYFLETDKDITVWKNLARNPGLESLLQPMALDDRDMNVGGSANLSSVEVEYSHSGKGVKIKPASDSTINTAAYVTPYQHPTTSTIIGVDGNWKGQTFTISATIEVLKKQTGTLSPEARSISVTNRTPGSTGQIGKAQAPNTVGRHDLSLTFTVPSNATIFDIRLMNGSTVPDEEVIWSDLCVVKLPSNPIGYFDGDYSPDEDLTPKWMPDGTSELVGRAVQGAIVDVGYSGGVLIQSTKWSEFHGVSARLINNSPNLVGSPYVYLKSPYKMDQISVRVWQESTFAPNEIDPVLFGTMSVGAHSSTPKTNQGNTSQVVTLDSLSTPTDYVYLYSGVKKLGGSLWYDTLKSRREGHASRTAKPVVPMIFSEKNDDFISSETYRSVRDYKNVAYVTRGSEWVEVDLSYQEGLGRRVIWVDANDVELTGKALRREMELMGMEALRARPETFLIDGKVTQFSRYEYDKDYFLGDIVLVGNHRGELYPMRVTEYIFSMDQEGFQSYPTFTEEPTVAAGVWVSPEYDITWNSAEGIGTWFDQP